jgi:hypothetical protein
MANRIDAPAVTFALRWAHDVPATGPGSLVEYDVSRKLTPGTDRSAVYGAYRPAASSFY